MESTWAGDYDQDFERYWKDQKRKPLLIHWAGRKMNGQLAIDELFLQYLNENERLAFLGEQQNNSLRKNRNRLFRRMKNAAKALFKDLPS